MGGWAMRQPPIAFLPQTETIDFWELPKWNKATMVAVIHIPGKSSSHQAPGVCR